MKILLSGGGSGGHLIPGIALYEEFRTRPGIELRYVLREQDMKYTVASRIAESDRMFVDIQGVSRKLSLKTPLHLLKLWKAFRQVRKRIRAWNPDAVVITGGYVANPVALTARLLRKPLFIVEPNSVAGATARFYAPRAEAVFTSMPSVGKLRTRTVIRTGNPSIFKDPVPKPEALKFFGLENFKTVIGVMGGSQGAKMINNLLAEILPELAKDGTGVVWSVGAVDYDRLEKDGTLAGIAAKYPGVKAFRFIDRMDAFFSACDCVVNRAGVTTIAEMIRFAVPSLLIPIKNSPDDHQRLNARYLAATGGSVMLGEDDLNAGTFLEGIRGVLANAGRMREALAGELPEAPAKRIAGEVLKRI